MKVLPALALGLALAITVAHAAPNVRLTNDTHNSIRPRAAFTPEHDVVVVWQDDRFGNYEILWQKFDRAGNALSAVVRVTNTTAASARPDVSCDASGNSHVVWQEGDNVNAAGTVYFCKLDASGSKIVNDTVVYSSLAGDCRVAALPNGETNLVYQRRMPVDQDVYVRHATAVGVLNCEKHLSGTPNSYGKNPCIANASDGSAHVTWPDLDYFFSWYLGTSAVSTSCSGGVTAKYVGTPTTPAIDIAGNNEISSFVLGSNIYALSSSGSCRLTVGTGTCTQPSVAAESAEGWVAWRDTRDGNPEIYYARLVGCTNTSGDVRLTSATGTSQNAHIITPKDGSGSWVCVWADDRDGNTEIYLTSRVLIEPPNPNAPTNLVVALTPSACPPTASLAWTDASNNETGFEIQQQVDGGAWTQVATPGVNATSWTSGELAYGSTTAFRVRAVNGTYPSDWAGPGSVTVSEEHRAISGNVTAMLVNRPADADPVSRPLPRAKVLIVRSNGTAAAEATTDPSTGHYVIADVAVHCGDQIVVSLQNDWTTTYPYADSACAYYGPATYSQVLPAGATVDVAWPASGAGATSSDPANAHFLLERVFADYWVTHIGVGDADRPVHHMLTGNPKISGYFEQCGADYLIRFGSRFAEFTTPVAHEFAHAMLHRHAGRLMNPSSKESDWPQAAAMDEALADYFAAAAAGSPKIYARNWDGSAFSPVGALVDRTLTHVHHFPVCNGLYTPVGKYPDSEVLSGALWDWRERLANDRGQSRDEIDRAVWDVAFTVARMTTAERTFIQFRTTLEATTLGTSYRSDLEWAFNRHNVKTTPDNTCPVRPRITNLVMSLIPGGRQTRVQWEPVPGTTRYRVYARPVGGGGGAWISAGIVIADSVVGTEYTHLEPDTTILTAFLVASVDDTTGEDMAMSEEVPLVTSVDSGPAAPDGALAIRAWPNPSRGVITIEFGASRTAPSALVVCDVAGRVVRRLAAPAVAGDGTWRASWDGTAADGRRAAPGIYLVRSLGAEPRSVRVVWMP